MRKYIITAIILVITASTVVYAAPTFRIERGLNPELNQTYDLGSGTAYWDDLFTKNVRLATTTAGCLSTTADGLIIASSTPCGTGGGGSATPGGVATNVQFNDSSVLGGDSGFVYNKTSVLVGIGTTSPYSALSVVGTVVARDFNATSSCYSFGNSCIKGGRNFFVDSVAGSNSNSGTASTSPWQTIAKVTSNGIREGDVIYLKRGSYWREELKINSDYVRVEAYGNGSRPTLDASDIVTSWTKTGGLTNVYEAAVTVTANGVWVNVWENGGFLRRVASAAAADATAGTYSVTAEAGAITVYVHAIGSGNPASNGKKYEVSVRESGFWAGYNGQTYPTDIVVKGIRTLNEAGGAGSLNTGINTWIEDVHADNGGKHNLLMGSGVLRDVSISGYYWGGQGAAATTYYVNATPTGLATYMENLTITSSTTGDWNVNGVIGHAGGVGSYSKYTCNNCHFIGANFVTPNEATVSEIINSSVSSTTIGITVQGKTIIRNSMISGGQAMQFQVGGTHATATDSSFFTETPSGLAINVVTAVATATTTLDIRNSVIGGQDVQANIGIFQQVASTTVRSYGNKFVRVNKAYSILATTANADFTSDGNDFAGVPNLYSGFTIAGTGDVSLSTWRTQTGEDSNSYVGRSFWTNISAGNVEFQGAASTSQLIIPVTTSASSGGLYFGSQAALHNYGTQNMFGGNPSGNFTMSGGRNTGFGYNTVTGITSGAGNSGFGFAAGSGISGGSQNTCIGYETCASLGASSANTILGYGAGGGITGASNIVIGPSITTTSAGAANELNIGNVLFGTSINGALGTGRVGIATSTPGSIFSIDGVANFSTGTSTFSSTAGVNIKGGCFSINGVCVGGGTGSGTVSSAINGQIAYYNADGTTVVGTSTQMGYFGAYTATSTTATSTLRGGLVVDTTTLVVDRSTNKVGVNKANPAYDLDVSGTINAPIINIPNTTSYTNGVINMGDSLFIHNYGSTQSTYVGQQIGWNSPSGGRNSAFGYGACGPVTSGGGNNCFGFNAGGSMTTGAQNQCIGYESCGTLGTGNGNVAIGYQAGNTLTAGAANNFILATAGQVPLVGGSAQMNLANIIWGFNVNTTEADTLANGRVGIASTTPWKVFSVKGTVAVDGLSAAASGDSAVCINDVSKEITFNSGVVSCLVSAKRFKENFNPVDSSIALSELLKLTPTEYTYKTDGKHEKRLGLVADDVLKVDPRLVAKNDKGEVQSVRYEDGISAILIGAVQSIWQSLQNLAVRITGLEKKVAEQQKQIDELKARLDKAGI